VTTPDEGKGSAEPTAAAQAEPAAAAQTTAAKS
jgi:hypothetical protein